MPGVDPHVLMATPFDSVDRIKTNFQTLEHHFRDKTDRRAIFLSAYLRITMEIEKNLGTGRFHDDQWMEQYILAFANYYRQYLWNFENNEWIPKPWQIAFEAGKLGDYPPSYSKQPEDGRPFKELLPTVSWRRPLVVQELILGIHAHINYDLPMTLNKVGFDPDNEAHQHDHNEINLIIAEAVDAIQNFIISHYSPVLSIVDNALGNLDEMITCWTFAKAREHAWNYAVILHKSSSAHPEILNQMDDNAAVLARMILNPFGLSWILDMMRWVEDFKMKPKGQDKVIKWTSVIEGLPALDLKAWRTKK